MFLIILRLFIHSFRRHFYKEPTNQGILLGESATSQGICQQRSYLCLNFPNPKNKPETVYHSDQC